MDLDPVVRLALGIDARPGSQAILLGSGISSSAGIPTGWQVVEELARRVAIASGAADVDPLDWFTAEIGESPTYSTLISHLGLNEIERQAIVVDVLTTGRGTFPPPTAAHRAVGQLVAGGWINVVITTNFDPLLELAIEAAGGPVTVLSTADQVSGAIPLVHAGPVVLKVHGDYRDSRILNTADELSAYPDSIDRFLDRVFEEYGLIVCGWSGDHDGALRAAIDRAQSRRFGTFWAARGGRLSPTAEGLVSRRGGEVVPISDADQFLGQLVDSVQALGSMRQTPVSDAMSVAAIKREIRGEPVAIAAHDRLRSTVTSLRALMSAAPTDGSDELQRELLRNATGEIESVAALVATVVYWGGPSSDRWWVEDVRRLSTRSAVGGTVSLLDLPRVPGLVMLWTAGVAAVAAGRDDLLVALLTMPSVRDPNSGREASPIELLTLQLLHLRDPVAWMYQRIRTAFVDHLALGKEAFVDCFEQWQYILEVFTMVRSQAYRGEAFVRVDGFQPVVPLPHVRLVADLLRQENGHPIARAARVPVNPVLEAAKIVAERLVDEAKQRDWGILTPGVAGALPSGHHFPGTFTDDADKVLLSQ